MNRRAKLGAGARALVLVLAFLVPDVARAEDAASEALLQRGVELRRERHDAEALAVFREAYEKEHTSRALAQIALAEEALGQWRAAEDDFSGALAGGSDAWIVKHQAALEQAREVVRSHLGWLDVSSNVRGAEVWIDGAQVASLPAPTLRVLAGRSSLDVRAPGYAPSHRDLEIHAGDTAREEVVLESAAPEPSPPPPIAVPAADVPPAPPPPRPRDRTLAWVTLATGGALAAAGLGANLYAADRASQFDAHCPDGAATPHSSCSDWKNQAASGEALAVAGYSLSGAAAATAGVLFLTSPEIRPRTLTATGLIVSGVFVAAGVGAQIFASSAAGQFNTHCPDGMDTPDARCGSWKADVAVGQSLAIAGYALGGATLLTTGIFTWKASSDGGPPRPSVACGVAAPGTGVACSGTF
ncbi:MAG TPA: PEGA domain-containing protein [Polyangiaceae bacterium]|jgi:drug/metabolite transporter (DMT)-like permease